MNEDFPEPTALELSRSTTGQRYYIVNPETYVALVAHLDHARGYPDETTTSVLSPVEELPDATDGSGKLFSVSTFSVSTEEEALLEEPIAAGLVEEVDEATFLALLPPTDTPAEPELTEDSQP